MRAVTRALRWVVVSWLCLVAQRAPADSPSRLVAQALTAEARFDTTAALELFLAALQEEPNSAYLLRKISRQYSDSVDDTEDPVERKHRAEQALAFAQQALELEPDNPANVLSVAIAYGKAALYSDLRTRVTYSRHVLAGAERALALDPNYAWAHHVLGRWHHEVAQIRPGGRFLARLIYGGLPPASMEQAIQHLTRAAELDPDNVLTHVELGFAYEAAGHRSKAREHWGKGLALPLRDKHDLEAKTRAQRALDRGD
jgi:tetratricopeptide (TPR) repeat protein